MDSVIEIKNLSKKYRIGEKQPYYSLRDSLVGFVKNPFSGLKKRKRKKDGLFEDEFWALKDINFQVKKGEILGIIGQNGAGKSTLLKILSRITYPNNGQIILRGVMSSLLEVGTGFHPELTGRENIYLNGAILGMKRKEIKKKINMIIDFAGIGQFIDTPVKHYSSGMYTRLAFSIAAHIEPEIVIIDEVLAVGDVEFQKKCFGKLNSVSQEGKTVVLVSHNMGAVMSLCDRVMLLDKGEVIKIDKPSLVIDYYLKKISSKRSKIPLKNRNDRKGSQDIKITSLYWENEKGDIVDMLRSGQDYYLVIDYISHDNKSKKDVQTSYGVKDALGSYLLLNQSDFKNQNYSKIPAKGSFRCLFKKLPISAGNYYIDINIKIQGKTADEIQNAALVKVAFGDFFGTGKQNESRLCKFLYDSDWSVSKAES